MRDAPVAVDAAVDPHHRGMALRTALLERLEQIRGNVEIADAAAICHFPVGDDAFRDICVPPVHDGLAIDVTREVIAGRMIRRVRTDIQPLRARRIHLWRRTRRRLRAPARGHRSSRSAIQPRARPSFESSCLSCALCLVPCAFCLVPSTLPSAASRGRCFITALAFPLHRSALSSLDRWTLQTSSREIRCFSSH